MQGWTLNPVCALCVHALVTTVSHLQISISTGFLCCRHFVSALSTR